MAKEYADSDHNCTSQLPHKYLSSWAYASSCKEHTCIGTFYVYVSLFFVNLIATVHHEKAKCGNISSNDGVVGKILVCATHLF